MPFSHHSHSGQFCKHAKDSLEEVIQAAIAKGMKTYCLTEHMPRDVEDFYPEEVCLVPCLNTPRRPFEVYHPVFFRLLEISEYSHIKSDDSHKRIYSMC